MSTSDCGCGCGGASAFPSAFVRPRFFAGQLLTEDDLSLLTDYVSGKSRLHNRTLSGPGVVCGLEVSCDPCGTVLVGPGHALDGRGNDIVLACKEKVDVGALVRDSRVSSAGVRCDDPCDDERRGYGLFVRYEESAVDPVAPYATEEPCPTPGCVPSRVEEGFRFVVRCDTTDDHRYNPATRLLASIGPRDAYRRVRRLGQRFDRYLEAMAVAGAASDRRFTFGAEDAARYHESLGRLGQSEGTPESPSVVQLLTEDVRALAGALARYDTYAPAGQDDLRKTYELGDVDHARGVLGTVCGQLSETDPEQMWPEPVHRSIALAVVAEARARIVDRDADAPIELRLLAQGTPVSNVLAVELRSDLVRIREWLLGRLDRAPGVGDCRLRDDVRTVAMPQPLPTPEPAPTHRLTVTDLSSLTEAAGRLTTYLRRFVTDAACSTLNPPCAGHSDDDVLIAHLELDGCDVVRVCSATREQVLPGGAAYGEWLPKLYQLRHLAEQVCCQPIPVYTAPVPPDDGTVAYVAGLLEKWRRTGPLEHMWNLLVTPAPGETVPEPVREQVRTVPSAVTDSLQELNVLRSRVSDLSATVEALRGQLDTARAQVTRVREELPERLGDRLSELESAGPAAAPDEPEEPPKPPARRSTRSSSARRPRSGESS
jgi:hypothetical protein